MHIAEQSAKKRMHYEYHNNMNESQKHAERKKPDIKIIIVLYDFFT